MEGEGNLNFGPFLPAISSTLLLLRLLRLAAIETAHSARTNGGLDYCTMTTLCSPTFVEPARLLIDPPLPCYHPPMHHEVHPNRVSIIKYSNALSEQASAFAQEPKYQLQDSI